MPILQNHKLLVLVPWRVELDPPLVPDQLESVLNLIGSDPDLTEPILGLNQPMANPNFIYHTIVLHHKVYKYRFRLAYLQGCNEEIYAKEL